MKKVATSIFSALTLLSLSVVSLSSTALAGDNGGDEFRTAAQDYQAQAADARAEGMTDEAAIYDRLAEIKLSAADLADEGRWDDIDWTEYHQLTGQL